MSEELGDYMFVPKGSVVESGKYMNEVYKTIDALRKQVDEYKTWRESACKYADKVEKERDALRKQLELALAHDTQPYPTAYAYEKVCKLLEKTKEKLNIAVEAMERAKCYCDSDGLAFLIIENALAEIERIREEKK